MSTPDDHFDLEMRKSSQETVIKMSGSGKCKKYTIVAGGNTWEELSISCEENTDNKSGFWKKVWFSTLIKITSAALFAVSGSLYLHMQGLLRPIYELLPILK